MNFNDLHNLCNWGFFLITIKRKERIMRHKDAVFKETNKVYFALSYNYWYIAINNKKRIFFRKRIAIILKLNKL